MVDSWTSQVEVDGQTLSRPQMADCQMVNDVVMLVGLGPETGKRPDEPRKVRGRLVGTVSQLPRKASVTQFTSLLTDTVLASARPVTATARHEAARVQSRTSMTFGKLDYCMPSCGCVLPAYIWWSRVGNRRGSEWSRVGNRRGSEWSRVGNRRIMQLSMSSPRELLYCKGIGGDRWGFDSWNMSNLLRQAGLLHVKSLTLSINIPRLLGPQLNYWSRESALERAWLCPVFTRRVGYSTSKSPPPLGGVFRLFSANESHYAIH